MNAVPPPSVAGDPNASVVIFDVCFAARRFGAQVIQFRGYFGIAQKFAILRHARTRVSGSAYN